MDVAIIGYGKMGKEIEKFLPPEMSLAFYRDSKTILKATDLKGIDLCFDFSISEQVYQTAKLCSEANTNLVIGTTGWSKDYERVRTLCEASSNATFFGENFSIGVHIFLKLVSMASQLISPHKKFAMGGFEVHHAAKKDAPSGTALKMKEKVSQDFFPLSSLRVGSIFGIHEALISSPDDLIEIKHTSLGRSAYAKGAIEAAKWIMGKQGFYTMEDFLLC